MEPEDIKIDHGDGVHPPEDFSGLWEVYRPNKQLKYRADIVNGDEHGPVVCWWDNGAVAQSGQCDLGTCKGMWAGYWEDGTKFKETDYEDSNNFVVRWYDPDGNVERTQRFVDGEELSH